MRVIGRREIAQHTTNNVTNINPAILHCTGLLYWQMPNHRAESRSGVEWSLGVESVESWNRLSRQ